MYKKTTIAVFASWVLLLTVLPGCWGESKKEDTSVKALKTGLVVVDVNSQKQYDDCHIRGAIHANLDELDQLANDLDKEKSDVVFYCSNYMCTASGAAAKKFLNLGFKSVAAYEGGIAEWHQKGLPVDGPAQESYLKIVMNKPVRVAKEEIAVTADSVEEIEEALAQETELQEQKAEAKVIEIEAEALAQKMGLSLPAQEKQEAALQEQQAEEDELIAEEMLD